MNKISFIAEQYKVSLFVLILSIFFVTPRTYCTDVSDADLAQRVENLSSIVDIRYTSDVQRHIRNYIKYNKKGTEAILGRVSLYFPMFENVFEEKGLPSDLKYLSIIESGLKPTATSRVGASGLWQFMKPTGRMMGLKVNSTIDERRDPLKSTEAAAEYLKYLHEKFGDWTLALAAYNCGPGNVRKAIRKAGGKTKFWEIKKYLPKETRNYVPKFIAVSYIMNYYYDHGIVPNMLDASFMNTETATVYDKVLLRKISNELGVDLAIIKKLNPSYIRNVIPANKEGRFKLTLPQNEMYSFVNTDSKATLIRNPYLANPEPIKAIPAAREYISIAKLDPSITDSKKQKQIVFQSTLKPAISLRKKYKTTQLRVRETLKDIADREGLTIEDLLKLNAYTEDNLPIVGSTVKLVAID